MSEPKWSELNKIWSADMLIEVCFSAATTTAKVIQNIDALASSVEQDLLAADLLQPNIDSYYSVSTHKTRGMILVENVAYDFDEFKDGMMFGAIDRANLLVTNSTLPIEWHNIQFSSSVRSKGDIKRAEKRLGDVRMVGLAYTYQVFGTPKEVFRQFQSGEHFGKVFKKPRHIIDLT